jgi:3-oxoadipate enol-lactonase
MGGATVLDFAAEHPESVDAMVVASCGIGGHSEWSDSTVEAWEREDAAVEAGDRGLALQSQLDFWTPGGDDPEGDARLRAIAFDNLRVYEIEDGLASRAEPAVIGRLSEIRIPALIVLGRDDQPDIHRMGERMTAEMPRARKVVIPGDHLPNARAPEEFNLLVLDFLRESAAQS